MGNKIQQQKRGDDTMRLLGRYVKGGHGGLCWFGAA